MSVLFRHLVTPLIQPRPHLRRYSQRTPPPDPQEAAQDDQPQAVDVEAAEVARQQALVEEGMAEARAKVLRQQQAAAAAAEAGAGAGPAAADGGGEGRRQQQGAGVDGVLEAQAALRSFKEQQQQEQKV
jgi:hypothetical protein